MIIILEHSFFLLQESKQELENILDVAAAKYKTSQTQTAIEVAVKEVLHQDDGNDEKLCNMVEAIILHNRMCKYYLPGGQVCIYWLLFSKGLIARRKNVGKSCSIDVRETIVQIVMDHGHCTSYT